LRFAYPSWHFSDIGEGIEGEGEPRGHTTFAFDLPDGGSKAHNKIGQVAGLPEQTPHTKGLYPFLPSNIVTDCADL